MGLVVSETYTCKSFLFHLIKASFLLRMLQNVCQEKKKKSNGNYLMSMQPEVVKTVKANKKLKTNTQTNKQTQQQQQQKNCESDVHGEIWKDWHIPGTHKGHVHMHR